MIAYLDASALAKRYLVERGSRETMAFTADAQMVATSIVSRAEVAAALAKAARLGLVRHDVARNAQRRFAEDWPDLVRVPVTAALVERAEGLGWEHGLRGYDSVQLASALSWQESVGEEIVLGTFDQQLWEASRRTGLKVWPEQFPSEV
ncbi:MAG: type II toxin-antitoxin system VapC family toxin [Acidobacteriota bacterium]